MFSSVIDVFDVIVEGVRNSEQKGQACALIPLIQSFEFVFDLHLMKTLLALTNDLSQVLQRKRSRYHQCNRPSQDFQGTT